jgi:hypothetical protein
MNRYCISFALLLFVLSPNLLQANVITINFENLSDQESVTNQYSGLAFVNTIALTAGISLNEFEFPPYSGSNVVSDDFGPISIIFDTPVTSISGYFTYALPFTLLGFDAGSNQVGSAASAFSNNMALSGDLGSSSNELLFLYFANGISSITIMGDPAGGSFTLDDLTYSPLQSTPVPEPSTISLLFVGSLALIFARNKMNH